MPAKVQKSVRLNDSLADYVERLADEKGANEADVLRVLIRDGIRHREQLQSIPRQLRSVEQRLEDIEDVLDQQDSGGLLNRS